MVSSKGEREKEFHLLCMMGNNYEWTSIHKDIHTGTQYTCTPVMRVNEGGEWWEKSDEEIEQSHALSDI